MCACPALCACKRSQPKSSSEKSNLSIGSPVWFVLELFTANSIFRSAFYCQWCLLVRSNPKLSVPLHLFVRACLKFAGGLSISEVSGQVVHMLEVALKMEKTKRVYGEGKIVHKSWFLPICTLE